MQKTDSMPNSDDKSLRPFGRMLSIIGKGYLQALNLSLKDLDIDRNYYALLVIENANGNITQQELADLLEIDKVTMLRNIDYLSEFGYVKRAKNFSDKRKYGLELTEKAQLALPEIKKSFNLINEIALKGLSPKQITDFISMMETIKTNLNKYSSSL